MFDDESPAPPALDPPRPQGEDDDPRPVFQGEWAKAKPEERMAHARAVQDWKRRNGLLPSKEPPQGDAGQDPHGSADGAAARAHAALLAVLDDPKAPHAARVSAARELRQATSPQGEHEVGSALYELRLLVRELPEHERLTFLRTAAGLAPEEEEQDGVGVGGTPARDGTPVGGTPEPTAPEHTLRSDTVTSGPPQPPESDFVTPPARMDTGVASRNTGERSDFVTPDGPEKPQIASRWSPEQAAALADD
jgi:hypothetical protein